MMQQSGSSKNGDLENKHTDVLIANATFRDGENAGMPVPLHCTWYNISGESGKEFIQI